MKTAALLSALTVGLVAPALAQSRVPADLRRAMDQRIVAVTQADVATWDRLTADNFFVILPDGTTRTKVQRLAQLRTAQPGTPAPATNETVQMLGNTAVQRYQVTGTWVLVVWNKERGGWRATVAQAAPVGGDSATVRQAIDANLARFADAFKRGDVAALATLYADDAVLLNPSLAPWEGLDAIKQGFTGFFSALTATEASFTTHDIVISGGTAIERGRYAMRLRPKSGTGADIVDSGNYLTVWERQPDGAWKIIRDITNADPAAAR